MTTRIVPSLGAVAPTGWNALPGTDNPFLRHEFLLALEQSGCAVAQTGWEPRHVLHFDAEGALDGAMPLYLKTHSWGEFVFDFAWADAFHRAGQPYYPRLVSAVPFTPATGGRLLAADEGVAAALLARARALREELGVSSLHVLFPSPRDHRLCARAGLLQRLDCQFHWVDEGYGSFDGFLGRLSAEKRKKLRRERRRVHEAGITCRTLLGSELDDADLDTIFRLHALTFARYGNAPYLNREFFERLATALPQSLVIELAVHRGQPVACAVSLRGPETLYGRYWGSDGDYHSLHFELCYYRGIEFCLREGLRRFEPGTQGEHKLFRGFAPAPVWSAHEIADPGFAQAIGAWLERERAARRRFMRRAALHLPFRREPRTDSLDSDVRDRLAAED